MVPPMLSPPVLTGVTPDCTVICFTCAGSKYDSGGFMWLAQADAMIMPFIITLMRSLAMPCITGRAETPPAVCRLTPGASPRSCAVSLLTGACAAMALPVMTAPLAGASGAAASRGAGGTDSSGAVRFTGVFFTVLAGFGFFCITSTGGSVALCACAPPESPMKAGSTSAAAPAMRAQRALSVPDIPVKNGCGIKLP